VTMRKEFPDPEQRYAVCQRQYAAQESNESKS
jgi:hypothetical protein